MLTTTANSIQSEQLISGLTNETVMTIIGIILGGLMTLFVAWILDNKKSKRIYQQYLLDKRIECYSKALDYISFMIGFPQKDLGRSIRNDTNYQNALNKERELYQFYNEFAIFAQPLVLKKFDEIRNLLVQDRGRIYHPEAYKDLLTVIQEKLNIPAKL